SVPACETHPEALASLAPWRFSLWLLWLRAPIFERVFDRFGKRMALRVAERAKAAAVAHDAVIVGGAKARRIDDRRERPPREALQHREHGLERRRSSVAEVVDRAARALLGDEDERRHAVAHVDEVALGREVADGEAIRFAPL